MFDLHISCTKDISFLKINFADGSQCAVEASEPKDKFKQTIESDKNYQHLANFHEQNMQDEQLMQSAELPKIDNVQRPVKIANELQNLDI